MSKVISATMDTINQLADGYYYDEELERFGPSAEGEFYVLIPYEHECRLIKFKDGGGIWEELEYFPKTYSEENDDNSTVTDSAIVFSQSKEFKEIINKALKYVPKEANLIVRDAFFMGMKRITGAPNKEFAQIELDHVEAILKNS